MSQYAHEESDPIQCLVDDYEKMVHSGHVRFLDADDFDAIIEYYQQQDLAEDALNAVNYALAHYGYAAEFHIKKAELLSALDMDEEAIDMLQKAEYLDASNAQIFIIKAEILATLGQEGEALAALERAQFVATEKQYADIYVAQAAIYEASYSYERAFQALKSALVVQPDHAEALSRIWLVVELTESFQESADLHMKLIDQAPYAPVVWYNLGHALLRLGDYEKAADSFEYAYVIDEKFGAAYYERAGALMELELYEKAIECLEDACKYAEPDAPMYTRIGCCFEQLENFADAESYYSDAIRIAPDFDEGYYRVGECLFKRKNWTSAKTAYEAAFRLDSKNALYLIALAETHFQIENYDTAYLFFQDACDMAPDECQHWIRLATFHMAMKDYESAIAALDEAEMYNECPVILRYCKVACLYQSGQRQAALVLLQETLDEDEACHYKILFDFAPELLRVDAVLDTINRMG